MNVNRRDLRLAPDGGHGRWLRPLSIGLVAAFALSADAADPEVALPRMRELLRQFKARDLVAEFATEDFGRWPGPAAAEAFQLRGRAHAAVKDGARAEADFARAVELAPRDTAVWIHRGDNLLRNVGDDARAMAAYDEVRRINGPAKGWDTLTATMAMAQILTDQVKTEEALALLAPFGEGKDLAPIWRIRLLRALGTVHAAAGREAESLSSFREALGLESEAKPAAADHALDPAPVLVSPGPGYAAAARLYQGVPAIARDDASGRLWASWYTGGRGESADNFVVVATSGDDGVSWADPVLAIDPTGTVRAFDPCLWTAPDGRLHLFYAQNEAAKQLHDGRWGVWLTVCESPGRADAAWSPPRRIADGIMLNKPTVLRDGTWLLPVANWEDREHGAQIHRSTDGGKTFTMIGGAPGRAAEWSESKSGGGMEHMIVEREDGTLWMPMRIKDGLAETTSTDGGATWSPPVRSPIEGPGSRFHVRRLRSGRVLMVNHVGFSRDVPILARRSHLTAMLSEDEGRTWPHRLLLDERIEVSYPDAVETPDGRIYVIYDRGRSSAREILLAVITEADIIAGKPSPASRLRMPVSKATADR